MPHLVDVLVQSWVLVPQNDPEFLAHPSGVSVNIAAISLRWNAGSQTGDAVRDFKKQWLPSLLQLFTESMPPKHHRILAQNLALEIGGEWAYCRACRSAQRPVPGTTKCIDCCKVGSVEPLDRTPIRVFVARKGYYRGQLDPSACR